MYKCLQCENVFEEFTKIKSEEVCPKCGASNEIYSFEININPYDEMFQRAFHPILDKFAEVKEWTIDR